MSLFTASLSKDKIVETFPEDDFIQKTSNGKITTEEFNTWLGQQYLFGLQHFRLVTHALAISPRVDYRFWSESLEELVEELEWFEATFKEKGINIKNIKPEDSNRTYQEWFDELIKSNTNYLSLITAVYAFDICSYETWKLVDNHDYQEFSHRWSSDEVEESNEELRVLVDNTAVSCSENDKREARRVWDTIISLEAGI